MEKGRRRGGRVRQSGPSRQKQYGKGHTERTEAVRLKLACVGVGQRRLRLNLADRNPPTKSRQQHHKPHHGRPKSRTKTMQNRSKMCRILSPNRFGTLRLAKIAFGRLLARYFGRLKCARAAPRAVWGCPGAAKSTWKTFPGAPRTFKNAPGELLRRAWRPFVLASVAQDARGSIFGSFRDQISTFF